MVSSSPGTIDRAVAAASRNADRREGGGVFPVWTAACAFSLIRVVKFGAPTGGRVLAPDDQPIKPVISI
jgi:hypothetical protein